MTSYRYEDAEKDRLIRKAANEGDENAQYLVREDRKKVLRTAIEADYQEAMDLGLMDAAACLKMARHWI